MLAATVGVSHQRQLQRFPEEGSMETDAIAIPVPLKRPLQFGPIAIGAHIWVDLAQRDNEITNNLSMCCVM